MACGKRTGTDQEGDRGGDGHEEAHHECHEQATSAEHPEAGDGVLDGSQLRRQHDEFIVLASLDVEVYGRRLPSELRFYAGDSGHTDHHRWSWWRTRVVQCETIRRLFGNSSVQLVRQVLRLHVSEAVDGGRCDAGLFHAGRIVLRHARSIHLAGIFGCGHVFRVGAGGFRRLPSMAAEARCLSTEEGLQQQDSVEG